MSTFTMRTYNDSYLYKTKLDKHDKDHPDKRANQALVDFILNAHRIEDKRSDQFRGVVEEVKRQQTSTILFNVLMMNNVKICIGQYELPRAFKVIDMKDPKNDRKPMVFIDATGLIEFKNGSYICKKVDVLCAYLFDALIYLLYRYYPQKLVDNSTVTKNATDCFVSLFASILDNLWIPGYSANKDKITYLTGLYFLNTVVGKDINEYSKTIAEGVSGINRNKRVACDIYLNKIDNNFGDIDSFITFLADTFNLKGLNLQVFIQKWIYRFGQGTQYATELLTSFLCMISNAYSNSYIVGQRQIEACCDSEMVKLCNGILKAGVDAYGTNRAFMSESQVEELAIHNRDTMELAGAMKLREAVDERALIVESADFNSNEYVKNKTDMILSFCKEARLEDKINKYAERCLMEGIDAAYTSCINVLSGKEATYESGALTTCAKAFKNQLTDRQRYTIETTVNRDMSHLRELTAESMISKEDKSIVSKTVLEMREFQQYI